jgi:mannan endo-1,4-beta-mannosidase
MKIATILSIIAATSALPTDNDHVGAQASYSKVDGLKFNIDGVTKCEF